MDTIAIGVVCKTPLAGNSKTRLSPPLFLEECATISACFIADLARTIQGFLAGGRVSAYALYTPIGSEAALRRLLPVSFALVAQTDGDLGRRLFQGLTDILAAGHVGAILVNGDSPTLPAAILTAAIEAIQHGGNLVLGPALDGGYTLIGTSKPRWRLFEDIAWSTSMVYKQTLERAHEIGIAPVTLPMWYDIDDADSLAVLEAEFAGRKPPFSSLLGADAPATRRFFQQRQSKLAEPPA